MKKKTCLVLFCLLILCSFSRNKLFTFTGRIESYGNMPFNYPVIVTEDNKALKIKESKYSKEELFDLQARKLEITGYITKEKIGKTVEYYIDIDEIKVLK